MTETHNGLAGVIWAAALVAGVALAVRGAWRAKLDPRVMYWAGVCGVVGGIAGSHWLGLYVYQHDHDPWSWLRVWDGGKSFYGGLVGGAVALLAYLRLRRAAILRYADVAAPATALGYAIARAGCFVNGDDYGVRYGGPLAIRYAQGTEAFRAHWLNGWVVSSDPQSLPVFPVQWLHVLVGLALVVALGRVRGAPGRRVAVLFIAYGGARFALEWLRGDFARMVGPLSLQQLISIGVVVVGSALWAATSTRGGAPRTLEAQAAA